MTFRFVKNRTADRELAREPFMADVADDAADKILRAVQRNAPERSGYYRRKLRKVRAERSPDGYEARVVSDDPFAHLIEFGSAKNPPYRPLTKGVRDAGYEFKDTRR